MLCSAIVEMCVVLLGVVRMRLSFHSRFILALGARARQSEGSSNGSNSSMCASWNGGCCLSSPREGAVRGGHAARPHGRTMQEGRAGVGPCGGDHTRGPWGGTCGRQHSRRPCEGPVRGDHTRGLPAPQPPANLIRNCGRPRTHVLHSMAYIDDAAA